MPPEFCRSIHFNLLMVWLAALLCGSGQAAVFYVNDPTDTTNVTSLRGAIIAANTAGGYNIIYLSSGTYRLTISGADENAGYTGDLDVTRENLTIIGVTNTVIDATGLGDRVIQVLPGAQLALYNLAVAGGRAPGGTNGPSGGNGENGGGIYNSGILALNNCMVSNNTSGAGGAGTQTNGLGGNGGNGGGIYNRFALSLVTSVVVGNATGAGGNGTNNDSQGGNGGDGAGIYNAYRMTLNSCSVSDNTNGVGGLGNGNGGNGGGFYNLDIAGLNNCVLSDNSAGSDGFAGGNGGNGGGAYNRGYLNLKTCAFGSNSAGPGGTTYYVYPSTPIVGPGFGYNGTNTKGGGAGGSGGGLYSSGELYLNDCTVSNNTAGGGGLGGNSAVSLAYATAAGIPGGNGGSGGGICSTHILDLTYCTLLANASGNGGAGGNGLGTAIGGTAGGAGGNGGALYCSGTVTIKDSTLCSNACGNGNNGSAGLQMNGGAGGSGGSGGGLYNAGAFQVIACTINDNSCGNGGRGGISSGGIGYFGTNVFGGMGGNGGSGGGIFNATNKVSTAMGNTLIAQNLTGAGGPGGSGNHPGTNGVGVDFGGNYTSDGFNLIAAGIATPGPSGSNIDLVGTITAPLNPLLGPLQDNGGPTLTEALLPHSPAIDKGKSFGLRTDQRGHYRIHNFASIPNAPGGDGTDIGAFELDSPILSLTRKITGNVLSWEKNSPGYTLEYTTSLDSPVWIPLTGQYTVTHKITAQQVYYRLISN